jgi:hypothetical protein
MCEGTASDSLPQTRTPSDVGQERQAFYRDGSRHALSAAKAATPTAATYHRKMESSVTVLAGKAEETLLNHQNNGNMA